MILINALQKYCLAGLFVCSGFKFVASPDKSGSEDKQLIRSYKRLVLNNFWFFLFPEFK
jgi:hypothetical protein